MEAVKQQKIKQRTKRVQYKNRKSTILKGGKELSILCNINVCILILSPDGKLETWPENLDDVRACFRDAAEFNKRPRSDDSRKRVCHNPSQVKIDDDDDDDDGKRANKKMKTTSDDCHVIGNNLQGEEGNKTEVLMTGNATEDHHHQLSLYNCCGNYYLIFPKFGEWNNNFALGIRNYENQSCYHHHHHEGCSCSSVTFYGSRNDEFLVGDSSSSRSSYGGGGYSSPFGYEFLNLQNNHLNK